MTPVTHQVTLMYLKDIVTFVADAKDITKEEARHMMPYALWKGPYAIRPRNRRSWCLELVKYMGENNIDVIYTDAG